MAAGGRIVVRLHPRVLVKACQRAIQQPPFYLGGGAAGGGSAVPLLPTTSLVSTPALRRQAFAQSATDARCVRPAGAGRGRAVGRRRRALSRRSKERVPRGRGGGGVPCAPCAFCATPASARSPRPPRAALGWRCSARGRPPRRRRRPRDHHRHRRAGGVPQAPPPLPRRRRRRDARRRGTRTARAHGAAAAPGRRGVRRPWDALCWRLAPQGKSRTRLADSPVLESCAQRHEQWNDVISHELNRKCFTQLSLLHALRPAGLRFQLQGAMSMRAKVGRGKGWRDAHGVGAGGRRRAQQRRSPRVRDRGPAAGCVPLVAPRTSRRLAPSGVAREGRESGGGRAGACADCWAVALQDDYESENGSDEEEQQSGAKRARKSGGTQASRRWAGERAGRDRREGALLPACCAWACVLLA